MTRYHFIGVCGTAMATLAALLKARGHDVQGSDQHVYPPMSDFLARESIRVLLDPDDPDTVFRWLYLNDEQGERPATLVMQIECTDSPAYEGYTGTATFVSRASEAGGVLVIVLNPPAAEE